MRRRHTFLLTVMASEENPACLQGRIQFIGTGITRTFQNMADLQRLIESEITRSESQPARDEQTLGVREEKSNLYYLYPEETEH